MSKVQQFSAGKEGKTKPFSGRAPIKWGLEKIVALYGRFPDQTRNLLKRISPNR